VSKTKIIVMLLLIDIFLCFLAMGIIPLVCYLEIVDTLYKEYYSSMYSGKGWALAVFFFFLLFLIIFTLDAVVTSIIIFRNHKQRYYRKIVTIVIAVCINAYYLFILYEYRLMRSNDELRFLRMQGMAIEVIATALVLLAYNYIHKKLLGREVHSPIN